MTEYFDDDIRRAKVILKAEKLEDESPAISVEIIGLRNFGNELPKLRIRIADTKNITLLQHPDGILKCHCQISDPSDIDVLVQRIRDFPLPRGEGFDRETIGDRVMGEDQRPININSLKTEFESLSSGQDPNQSASAGRG